MNSINDNKNNIFKVLYYFFSSKLFNNNLTFILSVLILN